MDLSEKLISIAENTSKVHNQGYEDGKSLGGSIAVDQAYSPASENAQSGKAVAEALGGLNIIGEKDEGGEIFNDYVNNEAKGNYSHAEGEYTKAEGEASHSEGYRTSSNGLNAHAEGKLTNARSDNSHAEGINTETGTYADPSSGIGAHAEGSLTVAGGAASHAEGNYTIASGASSHTEGYKTQATYQMAHAEGHETIASGQSSHAEGKQTLASGYSSHAGGISTIASAKAQTAIGKFNVENSDALFIVGNGTSDDDRKNAFEVYDDGHAEIQTQGTTNKSLVIKKYVDDTFNAFIPRKLKHKWIAANGTVQITRSTMYFCCCSGSGDVRVVDGNGTSVKDGEGDSISAAKVFILLVPENTTSYNSVKGYMCFYVGIKEGGSILSSIDGGAGNIFIPTADMEAGNRFIKTAGGMNVWTMPFDL